ncbi:MAG TPA: hypothetical protein DDZ89_08790 [Clostridiales bacterium]|nr:hypothetical protein [Clostridiales bacterium]
MNTVSIILMFFTLLVCFALPILLIWRFNQKYKMKPEMFAAGFIVYLLFGMILKNPFLRAITENEQYTSFLSTPVVFALLLGLSAGLFDEVGRFIYYRVFVRDHMTWENGVALGLGFASLEAMVVTGGGYAQRIMFTIMYNLGRYSAVENNPDIISLVEELQNTPAITHFFAGFERLCMFVIHAAFSLLTMYAAKRGRLSLLLFSTLIHGVAMSLYVYLNEPVPYTWVSQLVLLAIAVAGYLFVIKRAQKQELFISKKKDETKTTAIAKK